MMIAENKPVESKSYVVCRVRGVMPYQAQEISSVKKRVLQFLNSSDVKNLMSNIGGIFI